MNMPIDLTEEDTAAPPLPPWLKGFLVTSKNSADVRRAGEEVSALCNDTYFKLANDDVGVPKSMEKPGETEVAYEKAESLLIPGCSGSVFVALRPDNNTVCPTRLAEALIEESDKVGAAGWTKTQHTSRIIPVDRLAPERDLDELAKKVIDEQFPEVPSDKRPDLLPSFSVLYEEHSAAMHLNSLDTAKRVADFVPKDSYRVDLDAPDRTILVVVAGGSAMVSVVSEYDGKFHHFKIHSAADLKKDAPVEVGSPTAASA